MTPDKARQLLDGTTPGDEWHYRVKWGAVQHVEPVTVIPGGEVDVTEEDAALIVAAPDMAAMIAGMREEWGVVYEYRRDGQPAHVCRWIDVDGSPMDHHAARRIADRKKRDGYDNVRIVRRYVTEPEEA